MLKKQYILLLAVLVFAIQMFRMCDLLVSRNQTKQSDNLNSDPLRKISPRLLRDAVILQNKLGKQDFIKRKEMSRTHEGFIYPGSCSDGVDNDNDGNIDFKDDFCPPMQSYCTSTGWCWINPKPFGGYFIATNDHQQFKVYSDEKILTYKNQKWHEETLHLNTDETIRDHLWYDIDTLFFLLDYGGIIRCHKGKVTTISPKFNSLQMGKFQYSPDGSIWVFSSEGIVLHIPNPLEMTSPDDIDEIYGTSGNNRFYKYFAIDPSNVWAIDEFDKVWKLRNSRAWNLVANLNDHLHSIGGNAFGDIWVLGSKLYKFRNDKLVKKVAYKHLLPNDSHVAEIYSFKDRFWISGQTHLQIKEDNVSIIHSENPTTRFLFGKSRYNIWGIRSEKNELFFNGIEWVTVNPAGIKFELYCSFNSVFVTPSNGLVIGGFAFYHYKNNIASPITSSVRIEDLMEPLIDKDDNIWMYQGKSTVAKISPTKTTKFPIDGDGYIEKIFEHAGKIWGINSKGGLYSKKGAVFKEEIEGDLEFRTVVGACSWQNRKIVAFHKKGEVYEIQDLGWEKIATLDGQAEIRKVYCKSPTEIYFIVYFSDNYTQQIFTLTERGVHHTLKQFKNIRDFRIIEDEVWAIGTNGKIRTLRNGKLIEYRLFPGESPNAIDGTDLDNLWLVGSKGAILKYDKTKDQTRAGFTPIE